MYEVVALETTLGNGAAGFIALVMFVTAWVINEKGNGGKAAAVFVLVLAIAGSFVLYASTWSQTWCGWLGNMLNGIGGMFGSEMSLPFVFSAACVASFFIVVVDIGVNIRDNPWAVGALLVAPVVAHGASGIIGNMAQGFFGGTALAIIEALKSLTGA